MINSPKEKTKGSKQGVEKTGKRHTHKGRRFWKNDVYKKHVNNKKREQTGDKRQKNTAKRKKKQEISKRSDKFLQKSSKNRWKKRKSSENNRKARRDQRRRAKTRKVLRMEVSMFHVHRDSYTAVSNNTRPTPRTRVGALSRCHPGHRDTPVGPGRTPTVHRCPRGEAVGGPSTNTTHVVRRSTEPITRMRTW